MIKIVPYDPTWPAAYSRARAELLRALGERLVTIEHTGSTSVPGLAAKPIIDICAATPDLDQFRASTALLLPLGYAAEDYGAEGRLFYVKRDAAGERSHHLHVFPWEQWESLKERMFAAHLRQHPEAAMRYGELKQRLAAETGDREVYTRAKTPLIQELMDAARAERGLAPAPVWVEQAGPEQHEARAR